MRAYQDGELIKGYKEIVPEKSKYTEEEIQKSREWLTARLDYLESIPKSERLAQRQAIREEFELEEKDNNETEEK